MNVKIKGISKKESEIIANLEFEQRYFFTSEYIDKFSKSKTQRYNIIKNLIKKKRGKFLLSSFQNISIFKLFSIPENPACKTDPENCN